MFLVHDINFHRSVAAASGNPIVASLVEMVSALYYERRRDTAARASERDLRDAAEMHRRIYQAIRARNAEAARQAMHDHLLQASDYQSQEPDEPARRRARADDRPAFLDDARRAPSRRRPTDVHMFDLTGRTAVVVGGTSGIGRVLALGLADAGADVVATGRRADRVDEVAQRDPERGRRTLPMPADVADVASLERLRDACLKELGGVHIMVYAAGVDAGASPTLDMDEADWDRILDTNLTGTLRACQVFGRPMVDARYGRIITIGSLSSFVGLFEVAAYAASKSGVAGLTRALAVEWASANVTVNAIAPGVFRTDLERGAARLAARPGVADAHADAPLRQARGAGRRGGVPGLRRRRRSSPATCSRSTAGSWRAE